MPIADVEHLARYTARGVPTAHGEPSEVKLGGFSAPTQGVSGPAGSARNDTTTAWAQGNWEETDCPQSIVKAMMSLPRLNGRLVLPPAATAMYCLPSTEYDAGGALTPTGEERPKNLAGRCVIGPEPAIALTREQKPTGSR